MCSSSFPQYTESLTRERSRGTRLFGPAKEDALMAHLVHTCPHCESAKMTFEPRGEVPIGDRDTVHFWNTFYVCPECHHGFVVMFTHPHRPIAQGSQKSPANCPGNPCQFGFSIMAIYPKPQEPAVPPSIPSDLVKNYKEAEKNVRLQQFDSAGTMFRKILDRATKKLAPAQSKKDLKARLQWLADAHLITTDLHALGEVIRDDGNTAAHDDRDYTEEEAKQMKEFTWLFMTYTFTLPVRVNEAQQKKAPPPAKTTTP